MINYSNTIEEELSLIKYDCPELFESIDIINISNEFIIFNIYYNDGVINNCSLPIKQKQIKYYKK
jgi:hypothetical protein